MPPIAATTAGTVAVAIICKTPAPGKSKTRLSPPLRPEECAAISACFIGDLGRTIAGLGHPAARPCAVYTPAGTEAQLSRLLPGFALTLQGEGDLGARLHKGVDDLLKAGHAGAILINSDSPTLPPAILEAAVEAVLGGDRMVIAPAFDGGYTLIGLSRLHARLFEDMPWSTQALFDLTMRRAQEIGLPAVVLDMWYDIDDAESFAMLEAEMEGRPPGFAPAPMALQDAPATRRFLEQRRALAVVAQ